ncbi:MAG: DJ-1/PfpI family protein [Candidatus Omnitrophica bacterium]|nr:DJ-1/PfpI family protein [Candidatus Omnitrophota bacterium]
MNKKALIILANGFEETEAVTSIDMLRRCGVEVIIAGVGKNLIKGSHGIDIKADILIDDYSEVPDAVILPGGMPGAENLASSPKVKDLILKMNEKKKIVAAICASPAIVFAPLGILKGKSATCYPGMEENFSSDVKFSENKVVQDENIITSRGPATSLEFAILIAKNLVGGTKADMIAGHMLY